MSYLNARVNAAVIFLVYVVIFYSLSIAQKRYGLYADGEIYYALNE